MNSNQFLMVQRSVGLTKLSVAFVGDVAQPVVVGHIVGHIKDFLSALVHAQSLRTTI